jgi:uncharacterized protein
MRQTRTSVCRMDTNWRKDAKTGYLDAPVYPTKAGVFLYLNKDGTTRRELRPKEEVHKADSLKILENKPHTNSHPPVLLNSKNTKQYSTGMVYGPHVVADDGIHTQARVVVTDSEAIADIERGKVQVSCGYTCDIEDSSGNHPEFGPYDAIQRNIEYNHLASEWRGRAGAGAAIKRDSGDDSGEQVYRFDAIEIVEDEAPAPQPKKDQKQEEPKMATIRIDERDFEVSESVEIAYNAKKKADAEAIKATKDDAEAEKKRADQTQAKLDEAQEKIKELEAIDHDNRIDAAIELREKLKPILGKDYQFNGKSDLQIKKDAIAKLRPNADLTGKSEAYIADRYEMVMEDHSVTAGKNGTGNTVLDALDNAAGRADGWDNEYGLME